MNDINPIKNPIDIPNNFPFFYFFLFLAFGVIIFSLWLLLKKEKKNKIENKKDLNTRKTDKEFCKKNFSKNISLILDKNSKEFSLQASALLKKFLSCFYGQNFQSLSFSEILSQKQITKNQKNKLKKLFFELEKMEFSSPKIKPNTQISKEKIKNIINEFS